eukprot:TRINITY_DN305_c0_g1_i1.p1 TRINITY_DN305_c0_g1~~TRINITY_DN305_c0_g1_i1.p1  ORF type:complete len:153 (+),score=28.59 TRINITY_DN305_c0_g1_i1:109-567(+)
MMQEIHTKMPSFGCAFDVPNKMAAYQLGKPFPFSGQPVPPRYSMADPTSLSSPVYFLREVSHPRVEEWNGGRQSPSLPHSWTSPVSPTPSSPPSDLSQNQSNQKPRASTPEQEPAPAQNPSKNLSSETKTEANNNQSKRKGRKRVDKSNFVL